MLSVTFYAFLTGCKGSAGSDNPIGVYYNNSSTTPQTIDVNITQDGRILRTSAPSGRMTLEASEDNTYNSNVVLKITENPSMGNESSFLTVGSIVYSITATRDGLPVNLLSHPLTLTLSNEERLEGAENYYIGIKDINGGDWQFVNLYSSNPSVRTSLSSKNQFSYSLYKNNILVALFSDVGKSLRSTPKVLGASASLSPTALAAEHSNYNEDLKVSILLAGENLSGLKAEDFKIKIAYLNSDTRDTALKVDDKAVNYLSGSGSNKYEGFGQGYAHYFQFVPLSSKYTTGYSPAVSFDINLKDTLVSGFPNNFIVEISNSNSTILPFGYSAILNFAINNSDTNTDTDTETETQTDTDTNTNTESSTDTGTGTNTEPAPKPTLKLNSPTTDFPVTNSTIELEFSDNVPWTQADITNITIDNNAEISGCSYSNKILSLSLKNRLNYETTYNISVSNLSYAENNTFTISTEGKARVSLKSSSESFPVSGTPIELEFSKEIPWDINSINKITIDNDVSITGGNYSNKVLSLSFSGKLNYSKSYTIAIAGLEGTTDNNLSFTTKSLNITPTISSSTQNIAPNTDGLQSVLQPKFFINFGKEIASSTLAASHIKLNGEALPESCRFTFDDANQTMTLAFTENLDYCKIYEISLESYSDSDGAVINSFTPLTFKSTYPTEILGSGTEEDPFLIYARPNLEKLNATTPVNYRKGGFYYKQMDDIVIKGEWTPIGDSTYSFNGKYDGNNKTISIKIDDGQEYYTALFGCIDSGSVSNLTIKDSSITASWVTGFVCAKSSDSLIENIKIEGNNSIITSMETSYKGAVVGQSSNSTIKNVRITGKLTIGQELVNTAYYIGSIVGDSYFDKISDCSVDSPEGLIKGAYYLGGLIGYCSSTTITNCYANINLEGSQGSIGGLVGNISGGSISKSYSNSSINIDGNSINYVGGLAGYCSTPISNSYSNTSISIKGDEISKVGGLTGYFAYNNLSNSYATGTIYLDCSAASYIGVTAGYVDEETTLSNTFSAVEISVADGYTHTSPEHYVPSDSDIPLWWDYSAGQYLKNVSGTNYVSEGYKESLNWDSDVWDNLTEGALPTLKN